MLARATSWRDRTAWAFRDSAALLRALGLRPEQFALASDTVFPCKVPVGFAARMKRGDPDDPLLRQVLPSAEEGQVRPGYGDDPLGEQGASPTPDLLRKYAGRVVLMTTGACGIHCRYCFRRHFPHTVGGTSRLASVLAYLRKNTDIHEVILSGGDPLCLSDEKLAALADALAGVGHVRTLRIHTRMPIVVPRRVGGALLDWIGRSPLRMMVVIHANHPNEIDDDTALALRCLGGKVGLLNQSVLLKGVNDNVDTLAELSERLFGAGVLPYYLHMLDPVRGAAHFAVTVERARAISRGLRARLPGYLVPLPVRETAGAPNKIPI